MRPFSDRLLTPIAPVVAVHRSSHAADRSMALLRRGGFANADMTIVGRADEATGDAAYARCRAPGLRDWFISGAGVGLTWAAFIACVVWLGPRGGAGLVVLAIPGACTLSLQYAAIRRHVLRAATDAPARYAAASEPRTDDPPSAWHLLVVVQGSRSDVALARAILAAG